MHFKLFLISAATMVNAAHGETLIPNPNLVDEWIDLGTAADYAILAEAGITNVAVSVIKGDIAVSPIAGTSMTGFGLSSLKTDLLDGWKTSNQIDGNVFAPGWKPERTVKLTTAVSDMLIAYNKAAGVPVTSIDPAHPLYSYINHGSGELGGKTLTAGVYEFGVDVTIKEGELTFKGTANDVFIIKTTKNVFADKNVKLQNNGGDFDADDGPQAKNIFWQVAERVEVGASVHMVGTLLVKTAVKFITGSSLIGRILAGTAVTLQISTITHPDKVRRRRGLRGLQEA